MNAQQLLQEQYKRQAIQHLKTMITPGDTVYTIMRHVSRSGTSRVIDLVIVKDNKAHNIGFEVHEALGERWDRDYDGIRIQGTDMDMAAHLVRQLSRTLFDDNNALYPRSLQFTVDG